MGHRVTACAPIAPVAGPSLELSVPSTAAGPPACSAHLGYSQRWHYGLTRCQARDTSGLAPRSQHIINAPTEPPPPPCENTARITSEHHIACLSTRALHSKQHKPVPQGETNHQQDRMHEQIAPCMDWVLRKRTKNFGICRKLQGTQSDTH